MALTSEVRIVEDRFAELEGRMRRDAERLVAETTFAVERRMKESMAEPKHGRMYGAHQASAPGEPPAIDTADLVGSISSEVHGLTGTITVASEHGPYMEYGTTRVEPRPFVAPAAEAERDEFAAAAGRLLRGVR